MFSRARARRALRLVPNEKLYANPLLGVQATGNSNAIRCFLARARADGQIVLTMPYVEMGQGIYLHPNADSRRA